MIINEKLRKLDYGIDFIKKNSRVIIKGIAVIAVSVIAGVAISNINKKEDNHQTSEAEIPEDYEEDISYECYDTADKFLWDYSPKVRIDDLSKEEKYENIERYNIEINKLKDKCDNLWEKKSWNYCSNPEYNPLEVAIDEVMFEISTRERYIDNIKISLDNDKDF